MTSPHFTGVKQPDFDTMTGKHTEAAGRIEHLATTLYGELRNAGLDTAPALRIRELAERVTKQAEDLRRRQTLVREMERQKVTFGRSTAAGSFMEMPDGLDAAGGLLAGHAALLAAKGDTKALAELQKYAKNAGNADFIKAFLGKLGAKGVTQLPGSLAQQLYEARKKGDSPGVARISAQGKQALTLLSAALARGTDPKNPAYAGDGFLKHLTTQGRVKHTAGDVKYTGYQAQALLWRAHNGQPPFSKRFMEVVGRDAIVHEKEEQEDQWALSRKTGNPPLPLLDLTGTLGLGALLRTTATAANHDKKIRGTVVDDLLHAAGSKEAASALLGATPAGWKQSVLSYLLTTRQDVFKDMIQGTPTFLDSVRRRPEFATDDGPLQQALIAGTTGQDATSKRLAGEMTKILADKVHAAFGVDDEGNLELTDADAFKRLAFASYPLARALAANIDEVEHVLLDGAEFGSANNQDLGYALLLATSGEQGFSALIGAQSEHMKAAMDRVPVLGLNKSNLEGSGFTEEDLQIHDTNGSGEIEAAEIARMLEARIVEAAQPFGHIVEARRLAMVTVGIEQAKSDKALQTMVADLIGQLPPPGSKKVGELATGLFADILTNQYQKLAGTGYDAISRHVAGQLSPQTMSLDKIHETLADNRTAVEELANQMISTAMINKGLLDNVSLEKEGFATGNPPSIKPLIQMNSQEYGEFINWLRENSDISSLFDRFKGAMRRTSEMHDLLLVAKSDGFGDAT